MNTITLEQRRAAHALTCVEKVERDPKLAGRYRTYTESLPPHIVMGGLGQAVATELAAARLGEGPRRDDKHRAHEVLVRDLQGWLSETTYKDLSADRKQGQDWLIRALMSEGQEHYLHAHAEALAWLVWLKKFCQAKLPKNAEE